MMFHVDGLFSTIQRIDPRVIAAEAIDQTLGKAMKKHVAERWRSEDMRMHVLKA
jgi:hypothetical protein